MSERYVIRDHKVYVMVLDRLDCYRVVWRSETGFTKHAGTRNVDLAKQWIGGQA